MGRLSWHPNIVIVHETGTTDARACPTWSRSSSRAARSATSCGRPGPSTPAEALADMIQLCAAVHTAHEADLLHRDIKPDNALIDTFGRVKLADFGIAAVTGSTLTATGMVTATIAHAAPEVLNGARATFQADVYSLGSTLYELLAGAAAFVRRDRRVDRPARRPGDERADARPRAAAASPARWPNRRVGDGQGRRRTGPSPPSLLGQKLQSAQQLLGLKVTDLSVRGEPEPRARRDDHRRQPASAVVALTPPPAPAPAPPTPPPAAPTPPSPPRPRRPPPELAAPTGTVAVPAAVGHPPPPGHAHVATGPAPQKKKRSKLPTILGILVVLALAAVAVRRPHGGTTTAAGGGGLRRRRDTSAEDRPTTGTDARTDDRRHRHGRPSVPHRRRATTPSGSPTPAARPSSGIGIDHERGGRRPSTSAASPPASTPTRTAVWASNFERRHRRGDRSRHRPSAAPSTSATGPATCPRPRPRSGWPTSTDNTVSHIDVENASTEANIDVPARAPGHRRHRRRGLGGERQRRDGHRHRPRRRTRSSRPIDDRAASPAAASSSPATAPGSPTPSGDVVVRIDRETYEVLGRIPVGVDPGGMASDRRHRLRVDLGRRHGVRHRRRQRRGRPARSTTGDRARRPGRHRHRPLGRQHRRRHRQPHPPELTRLREGDLASLVVVERRQVTQFRRRQDDSAIWRCLSL